MTKFIKLNILQFEVSSLVNTSVYMFIKLKHL